MSGLAVNLHDGMVRFDILQELATAWYKKPCDTVPYNRLTRYFGGDDPMTCPWHLETRALRAQPATRQRAKTLRTRKPDRVPFEFHHLLIAAKGSRFGNDREEVAAIM
jgi:hypothetical protein